MHLINLTFRRKGEERKEGGRERGKEGRKVDWRGGNEGCFMQIHKKKRGGGGKTLYISKVFHKLCPTLIKSVPLLGHARLARRTTLSHHVVFTLKKGGRGQGREGLRKKKEKERRRRRRKLGELLRLCASYLIPETELWLMV